MRTLDEICNNPAIMMHLRFDLDKKKLAKTEFSEEDAGFYFCIYVREHRAHLALLHYFPDGKATQECIEDFPEDMILAAAKEAGGDIDPNNMVLISGGIGGTYLPINKPIEDVLRAGLMAAGMRKKKGGSK